MFGRGWQTFDSSLLKFYQVSACFRQQSSTDLPQIGVLWLPSYICSRNSYIDQGTDPGSLGDQQCDQSCSNSENINPPAKVYYGVDC